MARPLRLEFAGALYTTYCWKPPSRTLFAECADSTGSTAKPSTAAIAWLDTCSTGRYKAILVDKESYLLELCRYVVLNPVRAKLVASAKDWP